MALVSAGNFKTVIGAADLQLEAKKGESFLVRDVKIYSPAVAYAQLMIERNTVGYFRVLSVLGNHLQIAPGKTVHSHDFLTGPTGAAAAGNGALFANAGGTEIAAARLSESVAATRYSRMVQNALVGSVGAETILKYLGKKGIFQGYPVASGQTFTVDLITGATAIKIVEYDIYEEEDMKPEMPNGSKSDTLEYLSYGSTGANLVLQVDEVLDVSNNPPEFSDFPFGETVPSNKKIELIGILASEVTPAAAVAANRTHTQYLKLMHGTNFLFDEDHNGLLYYSPATDALGNEDYIAEGYAVGGNFSDVDRREPLMMTPPLVFTQGEKLTLQWSTVTNGAGSAISPALQEVACILRISPMG